MHIAVFTPGYGETAGAAGLRWLWLAHHLARSGAEVTVFHNTVRTSVGASCAKEVYLPGPADHFQTTRFKLFSKVGHYLRACQGAPILQQSGDYIRSAAVRYKQTPFERQASAGFESVNASHPVDVVIGVCAPWSTAAAARQVARRRGIPYVIEFQDPWRDYFERGSSRLHLQFVKDLTADAAALINVCDHWCDLDTNELGRPSWCVPNGFEPSMIPHHRVSDSADLRLAYLGTLGYIGHAQVDAAWRGLSQVPDVPWTLAYAGADDRLVRDGAAFWGLGDRVDASPSVPQRAGLEMLADADALLLFRHPTRDSHFGSKFAEYVACRRPIILVGRRDDFIIRAAETLTRLIACQGAEELERTVRGLAEEKSRLGHVNYDGDEREIDELSWPRIAAQLLHRCQGVVS